MIFSLYISGFCLQLACKNDLDQRALELIEMIANPQLITLATKYAVKLNRQRLAEKLNDLALSLQESESDNNTDQNSVNIFD